MEKNKITEKLAANLRRLMNAKSLSSAEVAKRSGISTGTISKIVNGNMSITIALLAALCKGLDISVEDILNGIIDKKEQIKSLNKIKANKICENFAGILSLDRKRMSCVKNESGDIIGTSELGGDLDLAETIPSVFDRIIESLDKALVNYKDEHENYLKITHLTVVVQSYEFEDTRRKFENYLKKYFKSVNVLSDWQITYLAFFKKRQGISLVVDKGVSISYQHNGELKKLGGWKFPIYDLGGENWLGLMAIRHTIEAYEGYVLMSDLAKDVLSKFDGKIEKILETCFKSEKNPDVYCLFAEILLRNYLTGDETSKKIVGDGFALINKLIEKVDETVGEKRNIVLNGSLSKIYKSFLPETRLIKSIGSEKRVEILADIAREYPTGFKN